MKELELTPKVEEVRSAEARPTDRWLGSITVRPGQFLWEYDPADGTLKKAEVKQEGLYSLGHGKGVVVRKSVIDPSKRYVTALNETNARRKLGLK